MTIDTDLLSFVSFGDLLGDDAPELRIPDFQRPYSWTPRIAAQLFTDVGDALRRAPDDPYVIGTVILLERPGCEHFEVVDGQQRLVTLHLLRALLDGEEVAGLASGNTPIHLVYQELSRRTADLRRSGDQWYRYRKFLEAGTRVLRIVTDDEDEAFQFFDSQNFRGKPLRPHDLLKAYHLREMAESSAAEQRAVVEQWEQADENDLDRLFGTYLARIHWWSRNLQAHAFTANDVDLFKGVGRFTRRLPSTDYHRAAKAVLPGLQEWTTAASDDSTLRDMKRTQHQLDAPVAAGKSFFEYAAFMLSESDRLDRELFDATPGSETASSDLTEFRDGSRFRFCRELYVAAALYYSNKFSDEELSRARPHLFRWAYALRLAYERLGWRSTDNYARGRQTNVEGNELNLFATLRDSLDPREVPLANIRTPESAASGHDLDERLITIMKGASS